MNENKKLSSPTKLREEFKEPPSTNSIRSHLHILVEDHPPPIKPDLKPKETPKSKDIPMQKNITCESPILKIAKKQKSKQIAEMLGEPLENKSSFNSFNSLDNELVAVNNLSPQKTIQTPQPTKSHKVSKSTFLQHKYLENLVAKPAKTTNDSKYLENLVLKPESKPFSINLTNVENAVINEVDPLHEETPNNVTTAFKFNKLKRDKEKEEEHTEKSQENNRKTMMPAMDNMNISKKEVTELDSHPFRHLIFAPKITENLFKKHLLITYKGIIYSQKLQNPSENFLQSRALTLPENKDRDKTLFIDLDETLIHSCHLRENPEVVIEIGDKKIAFNVRPYCKEFLEKVSKFYEVFLFTASSEAYAKAIINHIDTSKIIRGLFTDKVTMNTKNGFIIKDLRIFTNRNLKDMIIVDNLAHCFSYQIDNGVPLLEWQSDVNDRELKYLYGYLKKAAQFEDVRAFNIKMLKLRQLGQLSIDELKL